MDFSLDFSGLADIARDLETLSRAENNKVLRDATRAGAEAMRDAVVERAPERTGKLKKNVVVLTQRSKRRGEIISGVHIRGRNLRTGNSDNSMKASDPRNAFLLALCGAGNDKHARASVHSPGFRYDRGTGSTDCHTANESGY
ncbi:prophage protein [Escherichia coli]|uniref:Prophage protein n=1 Tax=Escherichia coli TaxID=562 RepID=A0AAX2KD83_ECOLX|nr:prophage protein [Escherichia coli]